jgi:hypothetical protein
LSNHDGCRARFDAASSHRTGLGFERTLEIHDSRVILVRPADPGPDDSFADRASDMLLLYKVLETMR